MAKLFGSYIDSKRQAAAKYVTEWKGVMYSAVVFGATLVVMFWASVFLYTSFYFTYMPQESVTWPIHFRYNSCGELPGICSNPNAVVSVTDPTRGSLLARGQKYRVVVDIEMPESPTNQRLGMFLVDMDMKAQGGEVLRQSSRSAMLRYKSPLLQTIGTSLFAPLLLYGVNEEKQMVTVELFAQYEEDPVSPLSEVHIELTTRHIELYASQLRIHAMFSGLRYFMYHYPLTAATVGIGICMVFLSAIVILSWYQFSDPNAKGQMRINPAIIPNGQLLAVSTDDMKSTGQSICQGRSSAVKKDQSEAPTTVKDKDLDDPDLDDPSIEATTTSNKEEFLKKEDSDQLPEAERRDSDEFEVVTTAKVEDDEGGKQSKGSSESDEESSVLRQRIQHFEPDDTVNDE